MLALDVVVVLVAAVTSERSDSLRVVVVVGADVITLPGALVVAVPGVVMVVTVFSVVEVPAPVVVVVVVVVPGVLVLSPPAD